VAGLIVLVLLGCFTPISRFLLREVHGSFDATPFTSLALVKPEAVSNGVVAGRPVEVRLSNRTGVAKIYSWSAVERNVVISRGRMYVEVGHSATVMIPTRHARAGKLRIGIDHTNIFVTVLILAAGH
jgi:hypothetical protein